MAPLQEIPMAKETKREWKFFMVKGSNLPSSGLGRRIPWKLGQAAS